MFAKRRERGAPRWVICDDFFPNPITGFRVAEYNYYLERHPGLRILSTNPDFVDQHRAYRELYPRFADRVLPYSASALAGAQFAYMVFLNNADLFLADLQAAGLPFMLTVYPGGGFSPGTEQADAKVERVFASDLLMHVITTQSITTDYLRTRNPRNVPITEIFGGVVAVHQGGVRAAAPGGNVSVAFVAARYMAKGENKGYPAFIDGVKRVAGQYDAVDFHVVGDYDPTVLDVTDLGSRITFHGSLPTGQLRAFLEDIDVIVSPNAPGLLEPGNFDGFPTGCCIEAALSGVAVLATDELELNQGRYRDGTDFIRIAPTADSVAEYLTMLLNDRGRIRAIGSAGRDVTARLFNSRAQLESREALIYGCLALSAPNRLLG